ncbi:hypothetical protein OG528_36875 [Streptomyces platensis]
MANNNPGADAAGAVPDGIDVIWERRNQHTDTPDRAAAARVL